MACGQVGVRKLAPRRCSGTGVKAEPNPFRVVLVWNVVSPIVSTGTWKDTRKSVLVGEGVKDAGGSECRAVIARIEASELPRSERRPTSGGSWFTRKERKGSTDGVT